MSKHNNQYWRNLPYLGFGAGAHSYYRRARFANICTIMGYINAIHDRTYLNHENLLGIERMEYVDDETEMKDHLLLGLRLIKEGVSRDGFLMRFKKQLEDVFGKEIALLEAEELLTWSEDSGERLHLTRKGILLGNRVFRQFV